MVPLAVKKETWLIGLTAIERLQMHSQDVLPRLFSYRRLDAVIAHAEKLQAAARTILVICWAPSSVVHCFLEPGRVVGNFLL